MARRGENIYKRKDGRWEGRYKNGFRENGKIKYSSVYGKSYTDVRNLLNRKKTEISKNIVHCKSTFKELSVLWADNIKLSVKESTYANYMLKLKNHIIPELGNIRYDELTAENINCFINKKLTENLSEKYVCDIISVIKSICSFLHKKYKYEDKSAFITKPQRRAKTERCILNDNEHNCLMKYLYKNQSNSNIGIILSYLTGLRIGELCALKWCDVDFDKRIITVRRTVQRVKDFDGEKSTKLIVTSPKSRTSFREIPIPDSIVSILEKLKSNDDSYILSGTKRIIEPRTMQYRFKSILKRLKLPNVSFHSLRHAFATKALVIGFDIKTLSEILGHSSVEITLNRYVHSSLKRKTECMKLMSQCVSFSG